MAILRNYKMKDAAMLNKRI